MWPRLAGSELELEFIWLDQHDSLSLSLSLMTIVEVASHVGGTNAKSIITPMVCR